MAFIRNSDKLVEGLSNRFFTNLRAKQAVQGDLDSLLSAIQLEEAARQSEDNGIKGRLDVLEGTGIGSVKKAEQDAKAYADSLDAAMSLRVAVLESDPVTKSYVDSQVSNLQGQITLEISNRQEAVSSEQSRAQAAEGMLSGRLDVIEGMGEGSISKAKQDAKDYADQKVADLVNSAPAVLDTLKELADAINNDQNFAATVAGEIGELSDRIDQEVYDRQMAISDEEAARQGADNALSGRISILESDPTTKTYVDGQVSGINTRLMSLEADPTTKTYVDGKVTILEGSIAQEASERQSAVEGEASARQLADTALSGRLDVIEGSGVGSVAKALVDAKAYADGIVASEQSARESADSLLDGRLDVLETDPVTKSYVDGQYQSVFDFADGLNTQMDIRMVQEVSDRQAADSALSLRLDVLETDPVTKSYVELLNQQRMDFEAQLDTTLITVQEQISQEISDREAGDAALQAQLDSATDVSVGDTLVKRNSSGRADISEIWSYDPYSGAGQSSTRYGFMDYTEMGMYDDASGEHHTITHTSYSFRNNDSSTTGVPGAIQLQQNGAPATPASPSDVVVKAYVDTADALLSSRIDALESAPGPDVDKAYVDNQISAEQSARQSADNALNAKINLELFSSAGDGFSLTPAIIEAINNVESSGPPGMSGTPVEISELVIVTTNGQPITLDQNGNNVNVSLADSYVVYSGDTTQYQLVMVAGNMTDSNGLSAGSGNFNLGLAFNHPSSSLAQFLFLPSSISVPTFGGMFGGGAAAYLTPGYTFFAQSGSAPESLGAVLQQEISDRQAGDSVLQGQIDTEKGRIDAILSAADADKDSFAEIVQLINSIDTSNDSAFASYVLSNDAALAQEVSDRQAGDSALSGRLDALESDPTTKSYVDSKVSLLQAEDETFFKLDGSRPMTGGMRVKHVEKSANYTLTGSDYIVGVTSVAGGKVMTLPSAATMGAGKMFVIKDQSGGASVTNYIRIACQSGEQIDGLSSYDLDAPYESVTVVSNGTHWFIM